VELGLIAAVALVAANAFFVGSEFSIARLRPTQAADFVREGRAGAKSAQHAVEHIDAYLSACQLGITISSLGLGAVGEPAFHHLLEPIFGEEARIVGFGLASAVAFLIITVAHVVLGELAPKSAAIARTAPLALVLAPPMRAFYIATKPFVDLFNAMGNLVLKPFGIPPASEAALAPHSEEELRQLLRDSREGGLLEADETRLSEAALVFGDLRAREVMRPRHEIDVVTVADSIEEMVETAMRTGRTRLPLTEADGSLDDSIGVINVKDLLPLAVGREVEPRSVARQLSRVAEGTRVDRVLRDMRGHGRHLALVVDEHGTVTGLLTLEDVLEELVGEIDDEFDTASEQLVEHDGAEVRIDGRAPVRLVARELGLDVEVAGEATVSGHVIEQLGRVPKPGELVEIDGGRLEVVVSEGTHISRLVARGDTEPPTPPEAAS
jgi:CBS domain containing-hemolysin-like protein